MYIALFLYFATLTAIAIISARKVKSASDFIIGNRSLNYWLTAMAAHASDMSSWLFMGYPALIFVEGMFKVWVALGLVACMWVNWQIVAKKFRELTGRWNCNTFSTFLHHRYEDRSGVLQVFSALFCLVFYVVYVCAHLTGLGILGFSLVGISYDVAILIGFIVVVTYVILGGYITLAWIDLVQGLFLLIVLCIVPYILISNEGGWSSFLTQLDEKGVSLRIWPVNWMEFFSVLTMFFGWGMGYFGQPHIITKFMGIQHAEEISKSRNVGMSWMVIMLSAATFVGLVGIVYFKNGLEDPQVIFIEMVKDTFYPFAVGLILCAILAATINVMSSQLLVLSSILTVDIYKRFTRKESSKRLLAVSRFFVIIPAFFALCIAYMRVGSIYDLVHYAWSGLGASFGVIVLLALYSNKINKYGAIASIIVGGLTAAIWPYFNAKLLPVEVDSLIPGFILSFISAYLLSYFTKHISPCKAIEEARRN